MPRSSAGSAPRRIFCGEWTKSARRRSTVFDFSMLDPAKADVRTLYERDKRLFFAVRLAVVKTSTYLRNPQLEQDLTRAIISIRNVYDPLVSRATYTLIDIQAQLRPIETTRK